MSDWNRAFRNDFVEPERLSDDKHALVNECVIRPSLENLKTWKDVFLNGTRIGMIRVRLCGVSEFKLSASSASVYCGDAAHLNSYDNIYSLAVLALREHLDV